MSGIILDSENKAGSKRQRPELKEFTFIWCYDADSRESDRDNLRRKWEEERLVFWNLGMATLRRKLAVNIWML